MAASNGRDRAEHVEGLWAADASSCRPFPSAHTNLTVLMMGEPFGEWMPCGEMGYHPPTVSLRWNTWTWRLGENGSSP